MNAQEIRLPNGMVGKVFTATVEFAVDTLTEIDTETGDQLAGLGLQATIDGTSVRLTGTPEREGEHQLVFRYPPDGQKTVAWFVNADPRSLWKELEPDPSLGYRKEHTAVIRTAGNGLEMIGASRRGRAHAHDGKFREDDAAVSVVGDWMLAVVADGAGSARFSREGSRVACERAIASLTDSVPKLLDDDVLKAAETADDSSTRQVRNALYQTLCGAAFDAYKALETLSASGQHALKDYATTLLLAICRPIASGIFVATFWIGDGAIALLTDSGREATLLGIPDAGEFSGQTRFLTMRDLISDPHEMLRRVEYRVAPDFCAVLLMTDGISDPKFGTDIMLQSRERWEQLWSELTTEAGLTSGEPGAEQRLLEWMDFWSSGEHDDRTLVVIRSAGPAS
jgi:serine/threonine protein phosphatase PrpC